MGRAFPKVEPKQFGPTQADASAADMGDLLSLVFTSGRLQILQALQDQPLRFTMVAKRLRLSESEVSRNLNRLLAAGFVSKGPQGAFHLSPAAHAVLSLVPGLSFLSKHLAYFNGHAVHQVPAPLLMRLNELAGARLVNEPFTIYGHLESMFRTMEKRFDGQWIIGAGLGQQQLELHRIAKRRLVETGANARTVMLRREMPVMLRQSPDFAQHFETRLLDEAPTSIAATEKAAVVWFEGLDGGIDFNYAFIGEDPAFLGWTHDLFEHYWSRAEALPQRVAPARR